MAERPMFPGTDHGPFGPPVLPQQPTPRFSASFGMGDFPGARSNPFGDIKKLEKGIPVNPFMEDLKDLFSFETLTHDFPTGLQELVANWKSTDRAKKVLQFGADFHQGGSLKAALGKVAPNYIPVEIIVEDGKQAVIAGLYGIIGRRLTHLPTRNLTTAIFDCVVDTDEGLTLATMRLIDETIQFRFHRGFKPNHPRERSIEDVVIPACKK